jgi:putative inorganic carbon (HCO3(-)) transporter
MRDLHLPSSKRAPIEDEQAPRMTSTTFVSPPPSGDERWSTQRFWHDALVLCALVLSMALYYLVGNHNISSSINHGLGVPLVMLSRLDQLYAWPFLLLFLLLCWYRPPFALALLPLSLPYYLIPKPVYNHFELSPAEIMLWSTTIVIMLQAAFRRRHWRYRLSLSELRARLGPFLVPILVFVLFAFVSVFIAYAKDAALRAFREEVFDPLLYLSLALFCLRSRADITRLLFSLFGTGLLIALLGLAQSLLFKNTLHPDSENLVRITTVYGSANSIALLFDYTLPIALAFLFAKVSWKLRLLVLALCLPVFAALYLSDSRGSWLLGIPLAVLFILALVIRNRKAVLFGVTALVVILFGVLSLFHTQITDFVVNGHTNQKDVSSITKRPWLWLSAIDMIHDSPWLGYGMDNWLCHYSNSWANVCLYPPPHKPGWNLDKKGHYHPLPPPKLHAYWILHSPFNGKATGMADEPTLSHPHNDFLQVWVSIGVFGLLAYIAVLVLFYRLLACILAFLHTYQPPHAAQLRWMTIGVGASMLASLVQGQIDSSFLEQDLAFCFWILVIVLLVIRWQIGMPWRLLIPSRREFNQHTSSQSPQAV